MYTNAAMGISSHMLPGRVGSGQQKFKTKVLRLVDCCLSGCVFSCAGLYPKIVQHGNGVLFGYDINCVHANLLKHVLQEGM